MNKQSLDEAYKKSIANLKETLDKDETATTCNALAWGYATIMYAKRLPDGKIEVETPHGDGEYRTHIFDDEEQTVYALFSNEDGQWEAGSWE